MNYEVYAPFADISFIVAGSRISAMRCLVSVRCPQLLDLEEIVKKTREKKTSHGVFLTIRVKEESFLTVPILLQLLDYIYSDNLDFPKYNINQILLIQKAATKLNLKRLELLCSNYLYTTLGNHNVHEMIKESTALEVENVKEFCVAFAHQNWGEFSAHKIGLDILGLDLFQEMVISLQAQKKELNIEYLKNIPQSTFISDMKELYKRMEFTDAIMETPNGEQMPFHRSLFAAHEPKLAQVFLDKKDHKPFKNFTISVHAFSFLQQYIYYGSCELTAICACEVIEELVQKYDLEKFRCFCEDIVHNNITTDNVLRVLALTYTDFNSSRDSLVSHTRPTCLEFVADNFYKINIPNIREIKPMGITMAHDLLDLMHFRKRDSKRRRSTGTSKVRSIKFK